jgi:hypothetical protein
MLKNVEHYSNRRRNEVRYLEKKTLASQVPRQLEKKILHNEILGLGSQALTLTPIHSVTHTLLNV